MTTTIAPAMKTNTPDAPNCAEQIGDHEGAEDHRQPAPGIDEARRAGANAGRKQLLLIGMEAVGHDVVGERQARAHRDDQRGLARRAENQAADQNDARRSDDDEFALDPVGDEEPEQRPDRRGERDQRGVAQAGRDRDALFDEQRGHPIARTVKSDRLENIEDAHQDHASAHRRDPEIDEIRRRAKSALPPRAWAAAGHIRPRPWPRCRRARDRPLRAAPAARASAGFRAGEAQEPDQRRRERADQHHPAPALHAERRDRHEDIGEERNDRHAAESDRLRAARTPCRASPWAPFR